MLFRFYILKLYFFITQWFTKKLKIRLSLKNGFNRNITLSRALKTFIDLENSNAAQLNGI
ncbi:MAG: hypothetical protein DRR16_02110 [Candidatus Parabeggiatoa sp. nov. 3]|nr:MAG: hypothetical protein DRR00_06055 [Gammaproteobacteria bacterium]RKZ65184.1 MAG: hypothetical protein DRQ99_13455 [Gammaproteobacteria bacterium]RKZ89636.1 MAG: hypothetical protein DRR16_02110 [Gammaproteobacteria bacterium]